MAHRDPMLQTQSQLASIFLARYRHAGRDAAAMAARFGLPPEVETHGDLAIPLNASRALTQAVADDLNDPFLGLHAAQGPVRRAFGLLLFMCEAAPTLREGLVELRRHQGLINDLVLISFEERQGQAIVEHRYRRDRLVAGRHGNEFSIALFVRLGRLYSGREWPCHRVWFPHSAPSDRSELVTHFGTDKIDFDADANGFSIDASILDLPIQRADPELRSVLGELFQRDQVETSPDVEVAQRIRAQIRARLRHGTPSTEQIASLLKMSPRTLQRRCADEGKSFQEIVDQVRLSLARSYLDNPRLSLGEVGYLLGYSNPRAFARAFRRWTGKTPSEFRQP